MRRNCNLELRLLPLSDDGHLGPPIAEDSSNGSGSPQQEQQQQQQLTIFYNGRVCVFDVTEFQARSILLFASREMEDKLRTLTPASASPALPSQMCSPVAGLSMKKSIQRFLQKRKSRVQLTGPYDR